MDFHIPVINLNYWSRSNQYIDNDHIMHVATPVFPKMAACTATTHVLDGSPIAVARKIRMPPGHPLKTPQDPLFIAASSKR